MSEQGSEPGGAERGPTADEPVGTLAEEAAKLFGALGGALGDRDHHVATGAPECSYCPVCRTVATVRQATPEVRAHLLTAANALVQAASGWLATAAPDEGRHPAGRSPGVEHIDLDDTGTDLEEDRR